MSLAHTASPRGARRAGAIPRLHLGLGLATALLGGCLAEPQTAGSPPGLEEPRISALVAQGALELDLAAGAADPTVLADVRDLVGRTLDQVGGLELGAAHRMSIRYLGKGRVGGEPAASADAAAPRRDAAPAAPALTGFDAFNPATGNEFRIDLPGGAVGAIGRSAALRGLDTGEAAEAEPVLLPSWSDGDDDRYRAYGLNAPVTNTAHRTLVRLGGGCSGTLVGPRHIVTAGHCLYNRTTDTWSDNFWARAGRNGTSSVAQVFVDRDAIPSGQVLWYFTPSQYRAETGSTWGYDFGVLVVPARLGDTAGWMGRVSYTSTTLGSSSIYRRGYPVCGDPDRTDDPASCDPHHLYANLANCSVGEYESQDADGWNRVVHHSCDASGGDSGSPLYVYHDGAPAVTGVHFYSECEKSPDDIECTGSLVSRPLAAIRLTPEYRDWIGYFRDLYP